MKTTKDKMLSKSASKLKMEWMMMSKKERNCYIIEMIAIGYLCVLTVLILHGEVNDDYTLTDAAQGIGAIAGGFLILLTGMLFRRLRDNIRQVERKKKCLRPEWTDQDLDLLDEDIEELYERVKALESRRY